MKVDWTGAEKAERYSKTGFDVESSGETKTARPRNTWRSDTMKVIKVVEFTCTDFKNKAKRQK